MALKLNYISKKFGVTFPNSYARILQFSGNTNYVNLVTGIYASTGAREQEKALQNLKKQVESANEEILKKQNDIVSATAQNNALLKVWDDAKASFEAGKIKEKEVTDAENAFKKADEFLKSKIAEHLKAHEIHKAVSEGLSTETEIQPIEVLHNSFPVTPQMLADNPGFGLFYNLLKDLPEFAGAEDV